MPPFSTGGQASTSPSAGDATSRCRRGASSPSRRGEDDRGRSSRRDDRPGDTQVPRRVVDRRREGLRAGGGVAAPAVNVRVKVGSDAREKRLRVTGDRYWDPATGAVSSIRPFTERCPSGGRRPTAAAGFCAQPLGRGARPSPPRAAGDPLAPNVGRPRRPVRSPTTAPSPVGLMAYDSRGRSATAPRGRTTRLAKTPPSAPLRTPDWLMCTAARPRPVDRRLLPGRRALRHRGGCTRRGP